MNSKTFKGLYINNDYEISSTIDYTPDVVGVCYRGDTLLVQSLQPVFDFGESEKDKFYLYDLIVDNEAVEISKEFYRNFGKTLPDIDTEHEDFDVRNISISDIWCYYINEYLDYELINEGDTYFSTWLRKKCPHGFVNEWGWKNDGIDHLDAFRLSFFNSSNKTIKSLEIHINFKDKDEYYLKPMLSNKGYDITLTCKEQIKPMDISGYQWDLSDMFIFNAEYCNISKIIIYYTDGTKYTLIKELKFNSGTFS